MRAKMSAGRVAAMLAACALLACVHQAAASQTVLVSVNSAGKQAKDYSSQCLPSRDGRYVAFWSPATNLAPKDGNGNYDIFRRDSVKGVTVLVSVTTKGASGNGYSFNPRISPDGRFVAFQSDATNLVSPPSTGKHIFLRDVKEGKTQLLPPTVDGQPINSYFNGPFAVSNGGRYILFDANASNLVPGDTNGQDDIFLYDSRFGRVERVSVGFKGQGNDHSDGAAMSTDARFIAFNSSATNLVPGDTNNAGDVFVRDRTLGTTERVSVGTGGVQGNNLSYEPAISDDGRFVAFLSDAGNLVLGDTDGNTDLFLRDREAKTTINLTPGDLRDFGDDGGVFTVTISAKGRYVTLVTDAALVPADTNGQNDAYVYDRVKKTYTLISVGSHGQLGNGATYFPLISSDGSAVAFESESDNLVPHDLNGKSDCFLRLR